MRRARIMVVLALALSIPLAGCGNVVRAVRRSSLGVVAPPPSDMVRARTAWAYFAPAVPAEDTRGAGFATPASLGDDIAATYAARRLGLIDRTRFDQRVTQLLGYLDKAALSGGDLPARFMDARTGKLIDPPGRMADPGWSGVEIGRLLVWLRILAANEPRHAAAIATVVSRWKLCRVINGDGVVLRSLPGLQPVPDSGTGFATVAALGLRAWGVAARMPAAASDEFAVDVEGINFPLPPGPQTEPLLTVPAALIAMTFGWTNIDGTSLRPQREQAMRLVEAQERRFANGVLTARSNFRRGDAPYTVENAILGSGFPWSVTADGAARPDLALVSVAAAMGLRALTPIGGYGDRVVSSLSGMQLSGGWSEGQYEAGGERETQLSASTNAMVMIGILHRQAGTFYRHALAPPFVCAPGSRQ